MTHQLTGQPPQPDVRPSWCLGIDADRASGPCLHCQTCAHLWVGQPGAVLLAPGQLHRWPENGPAVVRWVTCALRQAVEQHEPSVALLSREMSGLCATEVTAGIEAGPEQGGSVMSEKRAMS
jgi:hypothetical protein